MSTLFYWSAICEYDRIRAALSNDAYDAYCCGRDIDCCTEAALAA